MVARKKVYRKRRPRVRRPRRGKNRASVAVSRSSPIPDRFLTKLRYSTLHALTTAGVAIPASYQFRLNSIFDPDLTGTGHQPLGHDEMATLYQKYTVRGVAWHITFTNQSTTDYADVCVMLRPNTTAVSLMSTALETEHVRRGVVGPESGSRNIMTMKGYASIAKIRGVKASKVEIENEYSALIGANPNIVPTLQVYVENQNVNASITVNFRLEMVYYVTFFDRQALAQS